MQRRTRLDIGPPLRSLVTFSRWSANASQQSRLPTLLSLWSCVSWLIAGDAPVFLRAERHSPAAAAVAERRTPRNQEGGGRLPRRLVRLTALQQRLRVLLAVGHEVHTVLKPAGEEEPPVMRADLPNHVRIRHFRPARPGDFHIERRVED